MSAADRIPKEPRTIRFAWLPLLLGSGAVLMGGHDRIPWPEENGIPLVDRSHDAASIDVLDALPAELELLPGIGPGLARTMYRGIRTDRLQSLEELERIPGIGPVRAEAIRRSVMRESGD